VLVTANGSFLSAAAGTVGGCSITKGFALDPDSQMVFFLGALPVAFVPFSGTRGFAEPVGGAVTYNLVCFKNAGNLAIVLGEMSATYSATNITTAFTAPEASAIPNPLESLIPLPR
jgi:hypothetical protein